MRQATKEAQYIFTRRGQAEWTDDRDLIYQGHKMTMNKLRTLVRFELNAAEEALKSLLFLETDSQLRAPLLRLYPARFEYDLQVDYGDFLLRSISLDDNDWGVDRLNEVVTAETRQFLNMPMDAEVLGGLAIFMSKKYLWATSFKKGKAAPTPPTDFQQFSAGGILAAGLRRNRVRVENSVAVIRKQNIAWHRFLGFGARRPLVVSA
ncbi:hypothetical protein K470DRAFT_275253 [Piedraia hortae CBS 480.64]|uniref:Uncharacterized protein n=1 Tax=Piedraia hortae CBS 480.64 TaxID=1314780 RepID=A0A6A7C6C7_9PEZI|nr:hypothetical protein K470DRAFT_275253 [Piedraia hortae CBS 480.64]